MKQISVGASKKINIGCTCAVSSAKAFLQSSKNSSRVLIVTDREIAGYYLSAFNEMIVNLGKNPEVVILEPSTQMKSLDSLKPIFEKFIDLEIDQEDILLIMGGGSVIDVALFAYNIFSVPVRTMIFPTTLFSMIEASLTEVAHLNFQGRKDILNVPNKDRKVVVDTNFLKTVPAKVITNGSALIVQYGLLMDSSVLTQLSVPKNITQIIESAIITGRKIWDHNPKWLDFGHDIGDAIELHFRYYNYTPGEALALGLFARCPSSNLKSLYSRLGLPVSVDGVTQETLMKRIEKNMRKTAQGVDIVMLSKKGQPYIKKLEKKEALSFYGKALDQICQ